MELLLKQTAQLRRQLFPVLWTMLFLLLHNYSAMAAQAQVERVRVETALVAQAGTNLNYSFFHTVTLLGLTPFLSH
jgi:hypothetical protein